MGKFRESLRRLKPKFRKIFWTASKISVIFLFAFIILKRPRAAFASVELISSPASAKIGKNNLSAGTNLQATFNLHIIYLWIGFLWKAVVYSTNAGGATLAKAAAEALAKTAAEALEKAAAEALAKSTAEAANSELPALILVSTILFMLRNGPPRLTADGS